jgi:3-hydroxy acid dehydrogenase/malonic semialdehyde reductase
MSYQSYTPSCVFITGATGGFGSATARRFDAMGCKLIIHGRNEDKLAKLSAVLNSEHHIAAFDIQDKNAIERAVADLPAGFADVDCLVNNAGLALGLDKAQDASLEDWDTMVGTNITGLIHMTRRILPGMVERKRGHIINIGSIAGNWPYPMGNAYCASKAFVKQFSLAIRADLQGTNVRVTNIEPGMAATDFSLIRFHGDQSAADKVYDNTTPLTGDDVAETIFWAATLPEHVNINTMEVMPTMQSFGPLPVERVG